VADVLVRAVISRTLELLLNGLSVVLLLGCSGGVVSRV
jgi:hypothetical protein